MCASSLSSLPIDCLSIEVREVRELRTEANSPFKILNAIFRFAFSSESMNISVKALAKALLIVHTDDQRKLRLVAVSYNLE